ncbi:hypothetical protein JCM3770_000061 [Rhodotorula araucariae]
MDDALDTATVRPNNPLQDALSGTTPHAPPLSPRQVHAQLPPRPPARATIPGSPRQHAARTRSPPTRRSQGVATRLAGRPSPPPVHAQSQQEGPSADELEMFGALCRKLYYDKDGDAARQVDAILQRLNASFRTPYARTMATVRTAFHRDEEIRRRSHVESLLASTQPGATIKALLSISPDSTSITALRSSAARRYRRTRLREFIGANCTASMPGTHPFFKALFAALWVQAMDPRAGGAGERVVDWEVDMAVFTEAGGNEAWASEAIEALKGVLGMTERIKEPSHTDSVRTSFLGSSAASETSSVTGGDPVIAPVMFEHPASLPPCALGLKKEPPPVPPHRGSGSLRNRTGSDPFLHPAEKAAREQKQTEVATPLPPSSPPPPSPDPFTSFLSASVPLLASTSPLTPTTPPLPLPPPSSTVPTQHQFRIFSLPSYLTNPELRAICRLFPSFIAAPTRGSARFPRVAGRKADIDVEAATAPPNTKVGHGELRVGPARRDAGWRGTWWERLVLWLRAVLGLA